MQLYEKYRPKKLSDLVLPGSHRKAFKRFIKSKEIPHLLFYGPAGSGKTTLSKILIKHCASSSLVLNASADDRGIATIKKKVKQFATSVRRGLKLKVVFFDEANGLTPEAQEALKNTIETAAIAGLAFLGLFMFIVPASGWLADQMST